MNIKRKPGYYRVKHMNLEWFILYWNTHSFYDRLGIIPMETIIKIDETPINPEPQPNFQCTIRSTDCEHNDGNGFCTADNSASMCEYAKILNTPTVEKLRAYYRANPFLKYTMIEERFVEHCIKALTDTLTVSTDEKCLHINNSWNRDAGCFICDDCNKRVNQKQENKKMTTEKQFMKEILLDYHNFYLKRRSSVSDSSPDKMVDAYLNELYEIPTVPTDDEITTYAESCKLDDDNNKINDLIINSVFKGAEWMRDQLIKK